MQRSRDEGTSQSAAVSHASATGRVMCGSTRGTNRPGAWTVSHAGANNPRKAWRHPLLEATDYLDEVKR